MSIPNPATTRWIPIQGDEREHAAYWGKYEASRVYRDGDCAIGPDGILYLCTKNGTTTAPVVWPAKKGVLGAQGSPGPQGLGMPAPVVDGTWLKGVGGEAVWSPLTLTDVPIVAAKPSYGSYLPLSPVDGQEHILVDNVSSPTWSWRCRYNANSTSTYKWDVAGTPLCAPLMTTQLQIGLNVWTALSSSTIKVPRPGIYICQGSCRCLAQNGGSNYFALSYNNPGGYFGPLILYTSGSGLWCSSYIAPFQATFPNFTDTVGVTGYCTLAPGYFDQISWSIKPARIS